MRKHPLHVCDVADVPVTNISIQRFGTFEHGSHISYRRKVRGVAGRDIQVWCFPEGLLHGRPFNITPLLHVQYLFTTASLSKHNSREVAADLYTVGTGLLKRHSMFP